MGASPRSAPTSALAPPHPQCMRPRTHPPSLPPCTRLGLELIDQRLHAQLPLQEGHHLLGAQVEPLLHALLPLPRLLVFLALHKHLVRLARAVPAHGLRVFGVEGLEGVWG